MDPTYVTHVDITNESECWKKKC